MSIPERVGRIVRHKMSEIKERFDQMEEEALAADPAELERLRRAQRRAEAKQELESAMDTPTSAMSPPLVDVAPTPLKPAPRLRTPQEITGAAGDAPPSAQTAASAEQNSRDPLLEHYRIMGVEPGSDFAAVQAAYNGFAARTDPSRFPAGSAEAREAEGIRERLEASYKILRDALDSTAHRFNLLEI